MLNSGSHPIRLVIFDWAGTTVDFGSRAPAAAFRSVFEAHGLQVTDEEARAPMGANKRDHLLAMLKQERVGKLWETVHGTPWSERDVDVMYEEFIPFQLAAIEANTSLVPELIPVIQRLRSWGCKIGGTTGYFRDAAMAVARRASEAGYKPDANVCADDVPQGRPAPWMIYSVMQQLGIYPASAVVNIGDTVADIQSGVAAGCWSFGVCDSSSLVGLSRSEYESKSDDEKGHLIQAAKDTLLEAGAHAVLESIRDLPAIIEKLNRKKYLQPQIIA